MHGSVGAIFAALSDGVAPILTEAPLVAKLLSLSRSVMLASLKAEFAIAPLVHADAVVAYLRGSMAYRRQEMVRVLYLDASHRLILDDQGRRGFSSSALLPSMEIARTALALHASSVLIAHNHPSGNPLPSNADKEATAALVTKLHAVGITLHDHLIFARGAWASFRALGYLGIGGGADRPHSGWA